MSAETSSSARPRHFLGLFQRRVCLVPTWRGWLLLAGVAMLAAIVLVRGVYGFLAVQDSLPGGVLVVEGWASDEALVQTLSEFRRHHYAGLFVTGGPLEAGSFLAEYRSFAELSAAALLRLGADPQSLHTVPAPRVRKDRTYASAIALREWLTANHFGMEKVNLVSMGPHTRRSRLLFHYAFGPATRIGTIALEDQSFDSARWWRSSEGFRVVTGEAIAYLYARFLFRPSRDE